MKDRKGKYKCNPGYQGNRRQGSGERRVRRASVRFRVMGYIWDATNVVPRLGAKTRLTLALGWVSKFMYAKVHGWFVTSASSLKDELRESLGIDIRWLDW